MLFNYVNLSQKHFCCNEKKVFLFIQEKKKRNQNSYMNALENKERERVYI